MDDDLEQLAHHNDMLNRERESEEALDEAKKAGVSKKALMVLARESGCVTWALRNSLKGKNDATQR